PIVVVGIAFFAGTQAAPTAPKSEDLVPALRTPVSQVKRTADPGIVKSTSNQAPTINVAPSAKPNPVTLPSGTTVSVSAGSPGQGPSALRYTWAKVSGPGTVAFSPNGTTASGTSAATFSSAGSYLLSVSVSDGQ